MNRVYTFFDGRSTFFAFFFLLCGVWLAFAGKLTTQYVGLASGVQLLVVMHSVKEDYFQSKNETEAGKPAILT